VPDANTLLHFGPELILTIGILVVLMYDVAVRGRDGAQAWLAIATLVAAVAVTFYLFGEPTTAVFTGVRLTGTGVPVTAGAFVSDGFTNFFRLISLMTTLLVLVSGVAYMRGRTPFKGEFFAFLLSCALAMNLMAGANDLILIALAIEFLSLTSYILTAYLRGDRLSSEGGLKYFLYGSMVSAAMLFGLSLLYGIAGTTSVPALALFLSNPANLLVSGVGVVAIPALLMVLAGVGFKIALVPFHQWSPDAYEGAPTPVTAFLSVGPKAAGFAVMIRLLMSAFDVPELTAGWVGALSLIAILTMVLGNVAALTQSNVKRLMAYSSIAQAGYMLVGVVVAGGIAGMAARGLGISPLGSVLLFILSYLFTNLGAFAIIIGVDHATGSSELSAFSGLIRRAPFLAVAMFIFLLSLIGIPPFAGFVGKFAVFGTAIAGQQSMLALVGVLTGVVSVGYYFRIVKEMFFGQAPEDAGPIRVAPGLMFAVVVGLVMTVAIGILAGPFIEVSNAAAASLSPMVQELAGAVVP
jgi:proton-translocating NADH-quinone oxidoreductase chain N